MLCILAFTLALSGIAAAEPVYTVVFGAESEGTTRFVDDLSRLWQGSDTDQPTALAGRVIGPAAARLQALRRMQADFAIVDADILARRKAEYPDVAAVALLWPEALHVLAKRPDPAPLAAAPAADILVTDNAVWGQVALSGALGAATPATRWFILPRGGAAAALQRSPLPLLLASGTLPMPEVEQAMKSASDLRLLPLPRPVSEQVRGRAPWLAIVNIPPNVYPGQAQAVETLAVNQVLVTRMDAPVALVQHALAALFRWQDRMAADNPRFAVIDRKANTGAAGWFAFHPAAMKELGITASAQ
ncbi:MAG TPA: TAXI family TRAP transporter solute-binding subunit [bacterium]